MAQKKIFRVNVLIPLSVFSWTNDSTELLTAKVLNILNIPVAIGVISSLKPVVCSRKVMYTVIHKMWQFTFNNNYTVKF